MLHFTASSWSRLPQTQWRNGGCVCSSIVGGRRRPRMGAPWKLGHSSSSSFRLRELRAILKPSHIWNETRALKDLDRAEKSRVLWVASYYHLAWRSSTVRHCLSLQWSILEKVYFVYVLTKVLEIFSKTMQIYFKHFKLIRDDIYF